MPTLPRALAAAALALAACASPSRNAPAVTAPAAPPAAAAPAPAAAPPAAATAAPEPPLVVKRIAPDDRSAFARVHAGLEDAASDDCLGCHADGEPRIRVHASHPVGLDPAAAGADAGRFRPLADVRASGLALPGGSVGCITCHELASSYRHRLALPKGAVPRRAVVLGDPSTYGEDGAPEPPPPAPGDEISAKPLCQACHAF